jgi:hypothetical protein
MRLYSQQTANILLLILLAVAVAGLVVQVLNPHSHTHNVSESHGHTHDTPFPVPAAAAPRVAFDVTPDALGGFNVHIRTENFQWRPERVNGDPVAGEGHSHIYVDGEKINRVYGPWYKLPALAPGEHTVTVTLNTHDHSIFTVAGERVATSTTVVVPE